MGCVLGWFVCGVSLLAVPLPPGDPVRDLDFHRAVPGSKLPVSVVPTPRAEREGKILVLTVRIRNESREVIEMSLAQEWHGGEWPPTNLFATATPKGKKASGSYVPVYLAGEDDAVPRARTLSPGESIEVKLRADWAGTGSVKGNPLLQAPGEYKVQLILVFNAGGKKQYVSGEITTVHVPK